VATVRPAVLEDLSLIVDFQLRMASETEEVELDEAVLSEGVRAVLLDPLKGEYYIAMLDEEPVGCLLTVREWSDWRNGTVLWIHSVYVVPGARKQGVFRKLYENLQTRVVSSDGLKGLRLYVETENGNAQRVYEKMGMSAEHYKLFEWLK